MSLLDRALGRSDAGTDGCGCGAAFEGDRLVAVADDCPHDGRLADSPGCRATVVDALADGDATEVVVRVRGGERTHDGAPAALLVAAGRFVDAVAFHDRSLARRARRDPLGAARDATARAGVVADLAAETGLAAAADRVAGTGPLDAADYADVFDGPVVPELARMRVDTGVPGGATLVDVRDLETGSQARTYDSGGDRRYHLRPIELDLSPGARETLAAAHDRLAAGADGAGPDRAPERAVRAVADDGDPVVALTRVLEKHTTGYGVLADLFADDRVSDVYATAPVGDTPLRVVLDGCDVPTNVRLTPEGAESLASRLRRESGRAFSRASPTLDASATLPSGRVRVAGVTDPVSDGVAFAFRDGGREAWTLPALVDNDTVPPDAAALLSLAVERDAALLVAGSRGAGKTTLLGALLWELPPSTRTLVVEDTPELPVDRLRSEGRDVQALRTATRRQDGPGIGPAEALRTGLRMGESALVVGEVRGEEAGVLYEAMRVGAGDDAVLGTIHGDGAASVEERVTTDLGVPASSFAATDLVVTVARVETPDGTGRRLRSVEEVVPTADGGRFAPLYELDGPRAVSTGRIERGDSHVAASLTRPDGGYGDFLESLERRSEAIRRRVERGLLGPGDGSRGGSE